MAPEKDQPISAPVDSPLLEMLRDLEADGFTAQFDADADGSVRCLTCRASLPAREIAAGDIRRLEGASDPSDMLAIVPMRCASCGAAGVLVANYGPEATVADAEVLRHLETSGSAQ
ncbi:MAG TPA: hypothetical protein VK866_00340 [Acidimicrobiales bacterium]|nr:hypothetical protein [Acidimicrobiales bacterium]